MNELACEFADYTGPGCGSGDFLNSPAHYLLSNNGQFKLVDIPEPGSLSLFGIALLGVGALCRRRA